MTQLVLGADRNLLVAINKSYGEALEGYSSPNDLKKLETDNASGQQYSQRFYSSMNAPALYNTYEFLINSNNHLEDYHYLNHVQQYSIGQEIHNFASFFDCKVFLIMLKNNRIENTIKTIKMFSPEMYPHINNELIKPEDFKISFF
ncbi:hypothetical protein [Companilactobacillus sp. FL22-1]|uniref:hypothetical protein n=1 Tax=Companilactobacillus sp. FL22-1 TaxID=3373892 RepID=UPI003754B34B